MKRNLHNKKLLVIDDDSSVLFAFRKIFGNSGFQIDTSATFDEAIEFIDKNIYQLIITDLGFSETINEAGIAISHYAKEKLPGVKIILWTGMDVSCISEKARQAKIDLCLLKPVSPNVIQSLVEDLHFI